MITTEEHKAYMNKLLVLLMTKTRRRHIHFTQDDLDSLCDKTKVILVDQNGGLSLTLVGRLD